MKMHILIGKSVCELRYFEVTVGGKNALDHQISTYLGYLMGTNAAQRNYYIVSKDMGYKHVANFWSSQRIGPRVRCIDSIKGASRLERNRKDTLQVLPEPAVPQEPQPSTQPEIVAPALPEPAGEPIAMEPELAAVAEPVSQPEPPTAGIPPVSPVPESPEAPVPESQPEPQNESITAPELPEEMPEEKAEEKPQRRMNRNRPRPRGRYRRTDNRDADSSPTTPSEQSELAEAPVEPKPAEITPAQAEPKVAEKPASVAPLPEQPIPVEEAPAEVEKPVAEKPATEKVQKKRPQKAKTSRQEAPNLDQLSTLIAPYPKLQESMLRDLIATNKRQILCNTLRKHLGQEKGLALYNEIKKAVWR